MKFSIKKNIILNELTNVSRAISTRNIIPILSGIKFELTNDGLYLTASDSDLTIKSFIPTDKIEKVESIGSIIIQSKYIIDIIKKMPNDIVNFEVIDDLKIVIYTDTSEYNLNCLNSLDYPTIDLDFNKYFINISAHDLKTMIKQTIFAVSLQESRPLLTGVNIKVYGDNLECTTTDSYRLAKKNIKLVSAYQDDVDIVIPGKNVSELDKIIEDNEENVEMHIFNNKVLFKYKELLFQTSLLNGQYPNTSNFVPQEFIHIINTKLSDFYASIDRAALLTQSKDKNIVRMETEENGLCISSNALEIGKVEDHIQATRNITDNIGISFSSKYMMDALKTFEDEDIIIFMNSDLKPIVIKSANDESLIQLVVPIKTY